MSGTTSEPANPGPTQPTNPTPTIPRAAPANMTWEQVQQFILMLNETRQSSEKKYDVDTKEPETFTGDTTKARAFLENCRLQFEVNPHKFSTAGEFDGRLMIGYALSFCNKDVAHDFAQLQFEKYRAQGRWDTWPEFEKIFKAQFITIDEQGEALQQLTQLRMMKNDCDGYVGKFKLLASRAKITEESMLKHHFIRGLNQGLYKWLMDQGKLPETFDDLCEKVQQKNALYKQMTDGRPEWHKGGNRNPFQGRQNWQWKPQQQQPYHPPQRRDEYQGEPMEVDALSAKQVQLMKEGKCFQCEKRGHMARNCPDKKPRRQWGSNNPFVKKEVNSAELPKAEETKTDPRDVLIQSMMTQMKELQEELKKVKEDF